MAAFRRIATIATAVTVATTMAVAGAPAGAAATKKPVVKQVGQFGAKGSMQVLNAQLGAAGNTLYFTPGSDEYGTELWRTTGGPPALVADIRSGIGDNGAERSSAPRALRDVSGTLFFIAEVSTVPNTSQLALFTTKGTSATTKQVKKIALTPGFDPAVPGVTAALGKKFFFRATDAKHGDELWVSNGKAAGTKMVEDINPGAGFSNAMAMTPVGKKMFFAADDGKHGLELWVSNGKAKGTKMVKDIYPGGASGIIGAPVALGKKVFFNAVTKDTVSRLWVSDGTAKGTKPVLGAKSTDARSPRVLAAVGKTLYFTAYRPGVGTLLWKTDGTKKGTKVVKDKGWAPSAARPGEVSAEITQPTVFGKKLVFLASDGKHGIEPWITDGTAKGTTMIKDLFPGSDGGYFGNFHVMNGWVYFLGPLKKGGIWTQQVFRSDGKTVQRITDFALGKGIGNLTVVGNRLYFVMTEPYNQAGDLDRQLWSITG